MENLRDGDRALAALRHKPSNQTYEDTFGPTAYALDLRAFFAPSKHSRQLKEQPSDTPWRDRALTLENTVSELQAKYDDERAKILGLSKPTDESINTLLTPALAKKKGKKKNSDVPTGEPSKTRPFVNIQPVSPLLTIFTDLSQLISVLPSPADHENVQLLLALTVRGIEALASTLRRYLGLNTSPPGPPSDSLETLSHLLSFVVESVLPIVSIDPSSGDTPSDKSNAIVALLMQTCLLPTIQSFATLSHEFLHLTLASTKTLGPKPDVRQDLLHLLRSVYHSFGHLKYKPSCIPESLALAAVRELKTLYLETANDKDDIITADGTNGTLHSNLNSNDTGCADIDDSSSHQGYAPNDGDYVSQGGHDGKKTRPAKRNNIENLSSIDNGKDRVARLARKDALWYLCSVLHTLFGLPDTTAVATPPKAASSFAPSNNIKISLLGTENSSPSKTTETNAKCQVIMRERIFTGLCELLRGPGHILAKQRENQLSLSLSPNIDQLTDKWEQGAPKGHVPAGSLYFKSFSDVGVGGKAGDMLCESSPGLVDGEMENGERRPNVIGGGGKGGQAEGKRSGERWMLSNQGTQPIDKVARGMLLAVVERYWLWSSVASSGEM
ncbi:hypothetical protein ONZ45_g1599 [Pleurotus djamor]|nr:hypothetical protein ONZ45_g1599 [Pleurotus djamor]